MPSAVDLLLAAGRTVCDRVVPENVLAATNGVPVVFEDQSSGTGAWVVVHEAEGSAHATCLRASQIVMERHQRWEMKRLRNVVAGGDGVIRFDHFEPILVLLICGENNALDYGGKKSVWRYATPDD